MYYNKRAIQSYQLQFILTVYDFIPTDCKLSYWDTNSFKLINYLLQWSVLFKRNSFSFHWMNL